MLIGTTVLAWLQWEVISHRTILIWWSYTFLVAVARFTLGRCYWHATQSAREAESWGWAYSIALGLAGAGWGAAGLWLYPKEHLQNQVFLVFILGGMMLGAASLLAPRIEAFVAFMLPAGVAPTASLLLQGDDAHLAMGALAGVFVVATLITTWRIHLTIASGLSLHFENQDLVVHLKVAKKNAEDLNQELETRIRERTAKLEQAAEQLKAEMKQREEIEEELLRSRKLESLGVLAGGIAHDFNNFLTIVQGSIELAKMQLVRNESVRDILNRTSDACRRAARLSSQLLTFAKGGIPIRCLSSIAALITDTVALAQAGAKTSIKTSIAADLWACEVDSGQIGQVLHNILLNAQEAMPNGGIVELSAENVVIPGANGPEIRVRIAIRDYGPGIPFDVLPRIFDPYFTTKPGGRGLGLATAYSIIAKHGGSLSAESRPGHGAQFTIDLPASRETPPPPVPIARQLTRGSERLLVMDDEDAIRGLLKSVLASIGYEVQAAADGAEAIALFEDAMDAGHPFDVVLLDLTVTGGMGGLEAAEKLRELDPSVKLIVSSGYSDADIMSQFRLYGFDDVIAKPWNITELSEVLRRVLTLARDRS